MPVFPVNRHAPCPCKSGRRYKSCCFARDRARADMLLTAVQSHRAVDDVLRVVLPLVESRGEHTIACRAGCNACCSQFIRVTWAEALAIAAWLLEPEQSELLAHFEATLPSWSTAVDEPRRVIDALLERHAGPPLTAPDQERYLGATFDYHRRGAICPFNNAQGNCAIYPVRPLPCRATYVEGTADFCPPDRPPGPSVVKHPSLQGALQDLRALLLEAAHSAARPAEQSLPSFVAAALVELRAALA